MNDAVTVGHEDNRAIGESASLPALSAIYPLACSVQLLQMQRRRKCVEGPQMARRWVTAWEFDLEGWTDIALDEPSVLTEAEVRDVTFDITSDEPGRRQLTLWRPFVSRCAPGRWQVDVYLEGNVVLEARLRRPHYPRRRWNWADIEAGRVSNHDGHLWGHGDLNGGTFSFVRLAAADHYLREHDVPRSTLSIGRPAGLDRLPGRNHPLAYEALGGAALTIIQTMGDVPFLAAAKAHGAPGELELAWGLPADFW